MCIGSAQAGPGAPPPLPAAPPPAPTQVDPAVVQAGNDQKRRSAAASGYSGTITNSGGGAGLVMPAFTTGSSGYKALTGM